MFYLQVGIALELWFEIYAWDMDVRREVSVWYICLPHIVKNRPIILSMGMNTKISFVYTDTNIKMFNRAHISFKYETVYQY